MLSGPRSRLIYWRRTTACNQMHERDLCSQVVLLHSKHWHVLSSCLIACILVLTHLFGCMPCLSLLLPSQLCWLSVFLLHHLFDSFLACSSLLICFFGLPHSPQYACMLVLPSCPSWMFPTTPQRLDATCVDVCSGRYNSAHQACIPSHTSRIYRKEFLRRLEKSRHLMENEAHALNILCSIIENQHAQAILAYEVHS